MAVELNKLLQLVVDKKASDLHLTVGIPPSVRLHGNLRPLNVPPLTPEDTTSFMKAITPERIQQQLKEKGGGDFGFAFENKARFRVAIYKQKGNVGIALRLIPSKILSFEEIGLPPSIKNLLFRPRGLILVTGPTGSGKTTTLATMIDFINVEKDLHLITVEDPIEYYHEHKKSIITQREVGVDIGGFAEAIKRGLRMDPDVMLVGEMRDLETIQAAITAAETGHLVFATLHTTGTARTINRIVDAFPVDQQEQIRTQLSTALIAVVSQALLQRADEPGVIAAFEIMLVTSAIEHLIRENQTHKIISAIQTGAQQGMILLDDYLY
ncbi:MAG: type IV pilus twitching motility protein PilT, partial [Planctomycetota bacterium]